MYEMARIDSPAGCDWLMEKGGIFSFYGFCADPSQLDCERERTVETGHGRIRRCVPYRTVTCP